MIDSGSLSITATTWPSELREREQWLTWKLEISHGESGNGRSIRKVPRAPFVYTDSPGRYVDPHDPAHWTDFETASQWAEALPGHELAYDIANRAEHLRRNASGWGPVHSAVFDHLWEREQIVLAGSEDDR